MLKTTQFSYHGYKDASKSLPGGHTMMLNPKMSSKCKNIAALSLLSDNTMGFMYHRFYILDTKCNDCKVGLSSLLTISFYRYFHKRSIHRFLSTVHRYCGLVLHLYEIWHCAINAHITYMYMSNQVYLADCATL